MIDDEKREITAAGKRIEIFGGMQSDRKIELPLVIYHAVHGEGSRVWEECRNIKCPPFLFAVINDVNWNKEMSPWEIPPIFSNDEACSGGADAYLTKLTDEIMPAVYGAASIAGAAGGTTLAGDWVSCSASSDGIKTPGRVFLAGYSLAGLFAVYAAYRTDLFSGIISASGSLWYPDIMEFIKSHQISHNINSVYLSLGDKERRTRNPLLAQVEDNTIEVERYLCAQGINTIYESNPGNHYRDAELRVARAIRSTLII